MSCDTFNRRIDASWDWGLNSRRPPSRILASRFDTDAMRKVYHDASPAREASDQDLRGKTTLRAHGGKVAPGLDRWNKLCLA